MGCDGMRWDGGKSPRVYRASGRNFFIFFHRVGESAIGREERERGEERGEEERRIRVRETGFSFPREKRPTRVATEIFRFRGWFQFKVS